MSHNISEINGVAELAYTGASPWHKLGTWVANHTTAKNMLSAAHLDWRVRLLNAYIFPGRFSKIKVHLEGYKVITRDDTNGVLGIVTEIYKVIQNSEAGEMMDALIDNGATIEVAGALNGGKKCWVLAKIPETFEVTEGDPVKTYITMAWGHDGKHGLVIKLTPIRVVCDNTLSAALGPKWSQNADIYIRHVGDTTLNIREARNALGLVKKQIDFTHKLYSRLAEIPIDQITVEKYFREVFPINLEKVKSSKNAEALIARYETKQTRLLNLWSDGKGSHLAPGSAWNAYNAVTEYIDHIYPITKAGKISINRQRSAIFGNLANTKARALQLVSETVEVKT